MSIEPSPFSMAALDLRRSQVELRTYAEMLAERLQRALPERTEVERRRAGLFSKETHLSRIVFTGERGVYELSLGKAGIETRRGKVVRGVSISSTALSPPEWIAELGAEVKAIAEQTGEANAALFDFL